MVPLNLLGISGKLNRLQHGAGGIKAGPLGLFLAAFGPRLVSSGVAHRAACPNCPMFLGEQVWFCLGLMYPF